MWAHLCAHSIACHKKSSEDPVTGTFPNVAIDQIVISSRSKRASPLGMYCNRFPVLTITEPPFEFFCKVKFIPGPPSLLLQLCLLESNTIP